MSTTSIGTRAETSLHRDLKLFYVGQGGQTEAEVAGFITDGINASGEYIEVQSNSFAPLKRKAVELVKRGKLRIIYPVIITKYIEVFDNKGIHQYRRKSPLRGNPWNLFDALVYAPELPHVRRIAIELVLVDVTERRVQDGKGSWRRKGISIQDRHLLLLRERILLKKPADYFRFVPFTRNENFTSACLSERARINIDLARKTLYVLLRLGLVQKTGKKGNTIVYQLLPGKRRGKPVG